MKHLVIYTHPNAKSFCHAILDTVVSTLSERGDDVVVSDLYEKNFSPVLAASDFIAFGKGEKAAADIRKEQELVTRADNLIFIYPTWWFNRPAMLQGWIDRVFSRGFAFNADDGFEALLSGKSCNLFVTYGGAEKDIAAALGSVDAAMSGMTIGTLALVGIDPIKPSYFFEVPTVPDEQRHSMLDQVKQTLTS
jgi:NAD(P)H dehydrogenase (quinone)